MIRFRKHLVLGLLLAIGSGFATASTLITIVNSKTKKNDDTRKVSDFSSISVSGSYNVFITMGNTESIRLEGDANAINEIDTKVEHGTLKIRNKKQISGRSWNNKGKVNIYVQAKELNSLIQSGSGDIQVDGKIKSTNLSSILSGSGSMHLNIDTDEFIATVSGSGKIRVKGTAENTKIIVAGSGGFDGSNLQSSISNIKVSGSGNVSIAVDNELNALLSGSGKIRYSGNANVNSTTSGSGSISKL